MSELPVREMTLYKHGIGFFRREGEVEGDEVTLTFRHDAINDVLKSLVVVDQGEGHVRGIRYQTPRRRRRPGGQLHPAVGPCQPARPAPRPARAARRTAGGREP